MFPLITEQESVGTMIRGMKAKHPLTREQFIFQSVKSRFNSRLQSIRAKKRCLEV